LGKSPRPSQSLIQWGSGGKDFTPLTAAPRQDGSAGLGALTGPEAMLVLSLTVTVSNSYFHVPVTNYKAC